MSDRVGIMGGTFAPTPPGPRAAAGEAPRQLALDLVLFVPAGRPWQKPEGVTSAEDRYLMTAIATAANPAFAVSRLEVDAPGPTYTVDTLRRLRAELGEGTRLFFIVGADAILHLSTWKELQAVLEMTEFVAAAPPRADPDGLHEVLGRVPAAAGRIHRIDIPGLAISSTDIRDRVARGAAFQYLVPEGVARYIAKRGLYYARGGQGSPGCMPPPGSGT